VSEKPHKAAVSGCRRDNQKAASARPLRLSLPLSLSLLNLLRFPRFHRAIIADAPVSPVISASRAGAGGSPEAASRVNTGAPMRPSTEQRTIRWLSGRGGGGGGGQTAGPREIRRGVYARDKQTARLKPEQTFRRFAEPKRRPFCDRQRVGIGLTRPISRDNH